MQSPSCVYMNHGNLPKKFKNFLFNVDNIGKMMIMDKTI
jgi:hypothetical protein